MHEVAQLGYWPPCGGPWPSAGAAAEARSVANCMLRMVALGFGESARREVMRTGEGGDLQVGGRSIGARLFSRRAVVRDGPSFISSCNGDAAEVGKRGGRRHGSVRDGLGRDLEERDQTSSQAEKRAVWRGLAAAAFWAEKADNVRRWSESDATRVGTPPSPEFPSQRLPPLLALNHLAAQLYQLRKCSKYLKSDVYILKAVKLILHQALTLPQPPPKSNTDQ
jgi:hypothetical protein